MNKLLSLITLLFAFVTMGCSEEDSDDETGLPELREGTWLQSLDISTVQNGVASQSYSEAPVILKLNPEYSGDEESGEEALTITYCGKNPSAFTYSTYYNTLYYAKNLADSGEQWELIVDDYQSLSGDGASYYTEEGGAVVDNTFDAQLLWQSDATVFSDGEFSFDGGALGIIENPGSLCVNKSLGHYPEYPASISFHAPYQNEEITITLSFPTGGYTSITAQTFEIGVNGGVTIASPSLSGGNNIDALTANTGVIEIDSFTGIQSNHGALKGRYSVTLPDGNTLLCGV